MLDLVRELERHQIEPEARNRQLEKAKFALRSVDALVVSEERYRRLYEAAPISCSASSAAGFCT